MKKFLVLVMGIILSLFVSGTAFGAATPIALSVDPIQVWSKPFENVRVFTSSTTIAASGTAEFRIPALYSGGHILQARIVTATSTDFECIITGTDGNDEDDYDVALHAKDIDISYTWPIVVPQRYFNTSGEDYLYVTINNDDTVNATGAWYLILVEGDR